MAVPDFGNWCRITPSHTRGAEDSDCRTDVVTQIGDQFLRAEHLASQAITDANRDWRWAIFVFDDDVEVCIKCRSLEYFRQCDSHQ